MPLRLQVRIGDFSVRVCYAGEDANTIYVDGSATGTDTGVNWANAYTDLQEALTRVRESICPGTFKIYVAQGSYAPDKTPEDGFVLPENVSVYGGYRGGTVNPNERNPKRYATTLLIPMQSRTGIHSVIWSSRAIANMLSIWRIYADFWITGCGWPAGSRTRSAPPAHPHKLKA